MDTNARLIAKAVCWQTSGLAVMVMIGAFFTGSVTQGGAMAVVTTAIGLVMYYAHEKIWARITWGRVSAHGLKATSSPIRRS